ncbi:class I fructose-bisphosphate aldolase [Candidatus Pelagibacter communis]|uniref:class I fructose-bisphosphate aldolase n=1 Tax=Pelagibacter ubique TaxID=198252 RepID=UPI00094C751E|nr:class I fructose-bisphosphate aldolase [Candidatus Pelagibacter ubique]|tara:strand:+ start:593 stop:1603 length:1011 start_codon:yes stop_codon:yes gene_type:complete
MTELNKIAHKILEKGKGILAADESTGTMTKRLQSVNVESSAKNRILFRETLFSSKGTSDFIGGVILYDETIRQNSSDGKSIPNLLSEVGSIAGIKVDTGAKQMAGSPDEKITEGLDGLRERLKEYSKLGAKFTKWRGVYNISKKYPSKLSIKSNAHALARYAALVQECGMVPIVEPEVLMDGNHSADDCFNKTSEVIKKCFEELVLHKIDLSGVILKPNMILAGLESKNQISNEDTAKLTVKCLRESVPKEVPGIAFLSGGQTEIQATKNLNLINKFNNTNFIMSYSYGRALQQSALKHWAKDTQDIKGTQAVFDHRAKMCSLAAQGKWSSELENK